MRRWIAAFLVLGAGLLILSAVISLHRRPALVSSSHVDSGASAASAPRAPHVRGKADAPVTLEEFADFQCPPCGALFPVLQQVEADSAPSLRVIFRHHPLAVHPHARAAAAAAEAAGLQNRFWEMHDLLYAEQAAWTNTADAQATFNNYAKRLGLDVSRFERDCESSQVKAVILADEKRAAEMGVKGTPTIFINDWAVPRESYSVGGLRSRVNMMLANLPQDPHKVLSAAPSPIRR